MSLAEQPLIGFLVHGFSVQLAKSHVFMLVQRMHSSSSNPMWMDASQWNWTRLAGKMEGSRDFRMQLRNEGAPIRHVSLQTSWSDGPVPHLTSKSVGDLASNP